MSIHRRTFLLGSLAAGAAAQSLSSAPAAESDLKGLNKAEIPTPALLVDLDLFEANLKTLADHCKKTGCGFRPHAKTHKCPEIGKRQVDSGALGVSVATVPEAESMVAAGIRGVLLTSPIVEKHKVGRLVDLVKKGGDLLIAVSHASMAEILAEATEAAHVTLPVLIDLDVGDGRFGMQPGQPAIELAQTVAKFKSLRIRGVQAYAGLASHAKGFEQRAQVSRNAMSKAVETKDRLAKGGFDMAILSGGSTGTYNIDSGLAGFTELQVGSYVFMDVEYRRIGGQAGAVYTDFHPSLTVLTSVVSTNHPDRVTVDAGNKAFATDVTDKPEAKNWQGLTYRRAGDEFGTLAAAGATLPKLGDRLEFIVPHCDPTVNLYDRIYATRGDKVEAVWPVTGRKENIANKVAT